MRDIKPFLANTLVVLGVCVSALGASGFHRPLQAEDGITRESGALFCFLGGIVLLASGGLMTRALRTASAKSGVTSGESDCARLLERIRQRVDEIDSRKSPGQPAETRDAISRLMAEEFFDLTSRADGLMISLGFDRYARIWDGVATAERLLNRAWSMCADGYPEEAYAELPLVVKALESASAAAREA